ERKNDQKTDRKSDPKNDRKTDRLLDRKIPNVSESDRKNRDLDLPIPPFLSQPRSPGGRVLLTEPQSSVSEPAKEKVKLTVVELSVTVSDDVVEHLAPLSSILTV